MGSRHIVEGPEPADEPGRAVAPGLSSRDRQDDSN